VFSSTLSSEISLSRWSGNIFFWFNVLIEKKLYTKVLGNFFLQLWFNQRTSLVIIRRPGYTHLNGWHLPSLDADWTPTGLNPYPVLMIHIDFVGGRCSLLVWHPHILNGSPDALPHTDRVGKLHRLRLWLLCSHPLPFVNGDATSIRKLLRFFRRNISTTLG